MAQLPEETHRLIPGITVFEWAYVLRASAITGGLLLSIGLGFGFANSWGDGTEPGLQIFAALGIAVAAVSYPLTPFLSHRDRKELAAGYTTSPGRNQEVDWVDSRTGLVLRPAGEKLQSSIEVKAALNRAKQYLAEHPEARQTLFRRRHGFPRVGPEQ